MIEREVFTREMALLAERFTRTLSAPVAARYYETLSANLTTLEFAVAARILFDEETFWPAPARFIEAVKPSGEAAAQDEWEKLLEAIRKNTRAELSEAGLYALKNVGGTWRIGQSHEVDQLPFIKREFLEAYQAFGKRQTAQEMMLTLEATAGRPARNAGRKELGR